MPQASTSKFLLTLTLVASSVEWNDRKQVASTLGKVGNVYYAQEKYQRAIDL